MTDQAIIAASYAAEKNYSHNPDDVIDPSGAVGAWGTAKESTTELVDLSGHNNKAVIKGAMPTEGFIQGRQFDGVDDYLDCGNGSSLDITDVITLDALVKVSGNHAGGYGGIVLGASRHTNRNRILIHDDGDVSTQFIIGGSVHTFDINTNFLDNVWYHVVYEYNGSQEVLFVNGIQINSRDQTGLIATGTSNMLIGVGAPIYDDTFYINGSICSVHIYNHTTEIKQYFNTLARLPFWSVNYTDYPDNVAEYTDNLPYSSSIISSGTFKVDDDKLQCVSAGTMTYSASYEFDGSEYIKIEIGGVEYAGTGTITQGNTTVSVAQGSNKITITMGTGDTIEGKIGIQFREEV